MINLIEKKNCCGCGACSESCPRSCITMESDDEGFRYPKIDLSKCIDCHMCEKVCPIINVEKEVSFQQKAYLVQNKNQDILRESTSGGAFSAIAEYVINQGGVVFGGSFDEEFNVLHTWVDKIEDLKKFRSSKYVQSNTAHTYSEVKEFLREGRLVCYSGTPCQVEGLYHFLNKKTDNLILIDVVCHAAPSPLLWEKYKRVKMKKISGNIKAVSFRDKRPYGYSYSQISMETSQKRIYAGVESDPYLRAFFSNLSDRPSCYDCKFKKRYRVSDITIWDCFNAYKYDQSFDDNRGTTRVLVHSPKGQQAMEKIKNCRIKEISSDYAVDGVKEIVNSVPFNVKREQFFFDMNHMDEQEFFNKWFPTTFKVILEKTARKTCFKIGIYGQMKRLARKVLKKA